MDKVNYKKPEDPWNGLMIIGEAPGISEIEQGEPFVGASGKMLNEFLEQAKLSRDHTYICNVFRIRPTDNRIMEFFCSARAARLQEINIEKELPPYKGCYLISDYSQEIDKLILTITKCRPKVIVTLGATALWALTGLDGVTQAVGRFCHTDFEKACNTKVMPMYHPAYLMRNRHLMDTQQKWFKKVAKVLSK